MGLIHHHAIIATTCFDELFSQAVKWARSHAADGEIVTAGPSINNYRTLIIAPDGSKEGWEDSAEGDTFRQKFIERIQADNYEDGSSPWDYVEVAFGELGATIERTNCVNRD